MATRKLITRFIYVTRSSLSSSIPPLPNLNRKSFSDIPACPPRNLISLSIMFQRYGFSPSQLLDIIKKNDFIQNSSPTEIEKCFKTLLSLNPSHDFLVSIVINCPRVLEHEFLAKWKACFLEWGTYGITPLAFTSVLEVSRKFGISPDDSLRFLKCLKSLGFSEATITRVLEAVPMVIMSKEDEILGQIGFLTGIGIKGKEIDRVFGLFPQILAFGLENRLKSLLEEFGHLGFSLSEIRREVLRDPHVLGFENGELSLCLEMLRSLKCRVAIKRNIYRNGELNAGYKVKLTIDCLTKHGLSRRDAFTMMWKEPRVILYEVNDIEKKIEFLVHVMKFDIQCLVEVPEYLGVNFDKQISPRFKVIDFLRSNGALGDEVGLRNLIKLSRLRFYNLYVKPYPECEKIYGRFVGDASVKSRHPTGMWKLFRPQQYPQSDEDLKNIKSYVESLP